MKRWISLFLFILIIFILTLDGNSSLHTKTILEKISSLFNITFNLTTVNLIVRKIAHITEYFILYLFLYHCFKTFSINYIHRMFLPILLCLNIAFFDEICQLFVFGRSGRIIDVGFDFIGIFTSFILIYYLEKEKLHIIEKR